MITKVCSACKQVKPISEFYTQRNAPDGLNYKCKACVSLAHKQRRAQRSQEQVAADKEHGRKYYYQHRDKLVEYVKRYNRMKRNQLRLPKTMKIKQEAQ